MNVPRPTRMTALLVGGGLVMVSLVLATEVWVWLNLWPLEVTWLTALVWSLPLLLIWSLLIPVVVRLVSIWPVEGRRRGVRVAYHIAASVLFAFGSLLLLDVSDRIFGWTVLLGAPGTLVAQIQKTIIHLHLGVALYWVVVGAMHAAIFHKQARERAIVAAQLETHLVQARLDALTAQLQPHFLFNALNSIAVLVRRDADAAERTLHELSDFLREVLDRADESTVSLRRELELAQNYLAIERTRFQDRLRVEVDAVGEVLEAAVPSLLLQPIVENAVRHGIAERTSGGVVAITAERRDSYLLLSIRDTGSGNGRSSSSRDGPGMGLRNTRRRLETIYGNDYELTTGKIPNGGFEVTVRMPFERHEAERQSQGIDGS